MRERYDLRYDPRFDMARDPRFLDQDRFDHRYRQHRAPTIFYVFAFTIVGGLFWSELMQQSAVANEHVRRRTDTVVLVTGGTGTIGRAVHREIRSQGRHKKERWIFLGSRDGDLREDFETRRLFYRHHPTHVLHLAALTTTTKDGDFPVDAFRDNILMNDNIMECSREQQVKVVSTMSSDVFPAQGSSKQPLNESMIHSGTPHFVHEGYAYAKRMQELMNRAYSKQYRTKFTSVIPADSYGADDNFKVDHEHVIASLIHKVHLAKQSGAPLQVRASADTVRQFIFLDDLAKLLIWAVRDYDDPNPLILAPSVQDAVSFQQLVKMVADEMDFKGEIVFEKDGADEGLGVGGKVAHRLLSNSKLLGLKKDASFKPLKEGIKEAVGWFKLHASSKFKAIH